MTAMSRSYLPPWGSGPEQAPTQRARRAGHRGDPGRSALHPQHPATRTLKRHVAAAVHTTVDANGADSDADRGVCGDNAYGTGEFQDRLDRSGIEARCETQPPVAAGRFAE